MPKLSEFYVDIVAKVESAGALSLKQFGQNLGELALFATGAIGAITALGYEFVKATDAGFIAAQGFKNFSAATGESAEALQRWQNVAKTIGVPVDAVTATIGKLADNLGALQAGLLNGNGWTQLGIDPANYNHAIDLLDAVRDRVRDLPTIRARTLLEGAGLDPSLLPIFKLSQKQFDKDANQGIMTQSEIERMNQGAEALNRLSISIHKLTLDLVNEFEPAIEKIIKAADRFTNAIPNTLKNVKDHIINEKGFGPDSLTEQQHKSGKEMLANWLKAWNDPAMWRPTLFRPSSDRNVEVNQAHTFNIQGNDPHAIGAVVKDLQLDEYRKIQMMLAHGGLQ